MSYGLPYDTDEGRALAGAITAIMTGHAYEQSAPRIGRARLSDAVAHTFTAQGQRRIDAAASCEHASRRGGNESSRAPGFNYAQAKRATLLGRRAANGPALGYRNAQVTVLAPTGTIAFLMDCDTTGVEPDIALVKYKLLAGGGMLKIVNRTVPEALRRLGYSEARSAHHRAHREVRHDRGRRGNGATIPAACKPEHLPVFDCAFKPAQGQAQHPLHGASEDDGRRAAVHQRRDFQDGQHAAGVHRRGHPRHLRRRLEDGPEVRGHLSRRLEAFAAAQHQEQPTKAATRPPRRKSIRFEVAHQGTRSRSRRSCAPNPASRCAAACPTRARPSRTNSTSPATKVISPSACSRTASPANCSSRWPRKVRPSAA